MLEQWKRDHAQCVKELQVLNRRLNDDPEFHGWRHVSKRFELRMLLNKIACHKLALKQRIAQQETDDELTKLVAQFTDMPFTQAAALKRDMELNRNTQLSPLLL